MNVRSVAAALGAAALITGSTAGVAQAVAPIAPVEHYAGTDSLTVTECGLRLRIEVEFSGRSSIHPAPGSDEAFLVHDRYRFTERISLASRPGGSFVTTRVSGNFRETRATLIDPAKPTIYRFTTVDAGIFRLYSSTGRLLVSTSGVFKATNVQDTLGDKMPGSEFIEEISGDFHGNESGDFCEAIEAELT